MKRRKNIFGSVIPMDQMVTKFGRTASLNISFLDEDSCIDTWPPVPKIC